MTVGDTVMSVGAIGSFTVTSQLFDVTFPFTTQYISVVPLETAVTVPYESTVAILVFFDIQLFDVILASLGDTDKDNEVVSPTFNV